VICVIHPQDQKLYEEATFGLDLINPVFGGDTRQASIRMGLEALRDYNPKKVLIHDGVRPFVQVGYDSNLENSTRKEGEEWEDSQGRKWVWKNSSKRRVSKRATLVLEQRCTCCNMDVRWGSYLDDRVWPKTQMCYDCFTNDLSTRSVETCCKSL
jgi:hypothetical protein